METEIAQQAVSAAGSGPSLVSSLLEYGSLGIMVIFLAWQHLQMSKRQREDQQAAQERADNLVSRFEAQVENMQAKYEEREDMLRARYDVVIADLNSNRDTLKNEIHTALQQNQNLLRETAGKIDEGLVTMREIKQEAHIRRITREAGSITSQ